MLSLKKIESLFKMRQEYKECRVPREAETVIRNEPSTSEAARIEELISKYKN